MGRAIHTSFVDITACRRMMCVSEVKTGEARGGFERVSRGKPGENQAEVESGCNMCENSCFDLQ